MARFSRQISGLFAVIAFFVVPGCRMYSEKITLPSPRYLAQPPQYIPPSPAYPLPKETSSQPTLPALPSSSGVTAPPLENLSTPAASARSPQPEFKDPYVADLLDLITQTKSVDAFLVSVSLLAEAKPEARHVIPAVIRNAERLGIYGRYAIDEKAKGAEVAKDLTELIGKMIKGKSDPGHKKNASTDRMDDQPAHIKPYRVHGGIGPDPDNPYKNVLKTIRNAPAGDTKPTPGVNFVPNLGGMTSEVQSVITANNQFALDLYGQLGKKDGNLFFSPYSISKALAMVYAGARGDTEQEMAKVLHFTLGQDKQHQAFSETRKLLNGAKGAFAIPNPFRKDVQLYLSCNLWGQRGYGFQKSYLNLIRDYYGGELQEVDFANTEPTRKKINAWVEQQTRNRIKDLFSEGSINADTRLVLASAIYFKGDWLKRFKKVTKDDDFWIMKDKTVQVPLMSQTDTFGYFADESYQALQMPYQGKNLAMVVLLPDTKDGLAKLEQSLTAEKLADCMSRLREQKVHVWLPKFKMDTGYDLNQALGDLGMSKAFGFDADFGGMTGNQHKLVISKVVHKAFVEVNEEGTEAAAATGVEMSFSSARSPSRPDPIPVFRADHPFLFAITDLRTGMILFVGRVTNP